MSLSEAAKILTTQLNYDEARAMHFVKQFDKNGDGMLSTNEFEHFTNTLQGTKQTMSEKFKEVDADKSGLVSLEEAKKVLKHPPFNFPDGKIKLLLERFDRDGNGQLDVNEFIGFYSEAKAITDDIGRRFDSLDTDGNGLLSPSELSGVIADTLGYDQTKAKQFVDTFDINKDGHIDKKEFVGMWSIMFG
jgi:Ca2+-binding EF-hand superfamily protein